MVLLRDSVLSCLRHNIIFQARHIAGLINSFEMNSLLSNLLSIPENIFALILTSLVYRFRIPFHLFLIIFVHRAHQ